MTDCSPQETQLSTSGGRGRPVVVDDVPVSDQVVFNIICCSVG